MNKFKLGEKGAIQFIVLAILLVGIVGGVLLVTQGNPLKWFTRATTPPIVFKATNGSSLPIGSNNIPVSTSPTVRVELTSPLGPPAGSSPSAPVSGPNNRRTVSYKIAEDPGAGLNSALSQPYTTEPKVINYTFKDPRLGQKFIWVEFKASDGSLDRRTAQIEIVSPSTSGPIPPSATPTPTPTVSPTPTPTPVPPTSGGGGSSGGGSRSTPTPTPRVIKEFRYAEDPNEVERLSWQPYSPGMVVSHTFSDSSFGTKFIFVQFRDDRGDLVLMNGQRYISSSIELLAQGGGVTPQPTVPTTVSEEEVIVGSASLSTDSTVTQRSGSWGSVDINLNLSGFSTPGRSIAGLFFRNQVGECSINSCGYIGWTQIRSYGTNGTDSNPWTPPSSVTPGVHMFGVFSLNSNGTASQLLDVSATNFSTGSIPQPTAPVTAPAGNNCVPNVTTCGCGDPAQGRQNENPGVCYPECNGGWCRGGICATCKP